MKSLYSFLFLLLLTFQTASACDGSTLTVNNISNNGDGSYTFDLTLFVDIGLDPSSYGFVLVFESATPPTVTTFPATVSLNGTNVTGVTNNNINSIVNDSDWAPYEDMANALSYEYSGFGGATGVDFTVNMMVTVTGDITNILTDPHPDSGLCGTFNTPVSLPLPVELSLFEANLSQNEVILKWETESEFNNDYFDVEHSVDGVYFTPIAEIQGNGISTEKTDYSFTHRNPEVGINYYRLNQMDFDGRSEYSKVVTAEFESEIGDVTIYPNPAKELLTIELNIAFENDSNIQIFDLTGRLVGTSKMSLEKGNNQLLLDVSLLQNGVYFIQLPQIGMVRFVKN